jgi:hypothetical protein
LSLDCETANGVEVQGGASAIRDCRLLPLSSLKGWDRFKPAALGY